MFKCISPHLGWSSNWSTFLIETLLRTRDFQLQNKTDYGGKEYLLYKVSASDRVRPYTHVNCSTTKSPFVEPSLPDRGLATTRQPLYLKEREAASGKSPFDRVRATVPKLPPFLSCSPFVAYGRLTTLAARARFKRASVPHIRTRVGSVG